ncbi:hypothetical protein LOTGIDRAFT_238151 [Lottia gigantea]|uniref:Uncharacterized protein n=1 Tax=Lottia gigantea TaxID=225164 RepID=V4CI78_LOTGI|nr:hypothetical protein LOTGIDRAFT_238151 [Lottia gigantea]ESP01835.1 hypothetical protein LOTGIDRAFT_238151 [Lottia gigantea]
MSTEKESDSTNIPRGENYNYDQSADKRKVDPVNAGYDQPSDPPAYTPSPYGNQQHGHNPSRQYPMGQYPPGPPGYYPPPNNTNNVNVVMTQPQMATVIVNPRPNDYLGWSIFTLLCCCLPIGIAAIVFSCNARSSSDNLHFEQARKEANTARILNIVGLVLGLGISILMIVLYSTGVFYVRTNNYNYEYGK